MNPKGTTEAPVERSGHPATEDELLAELAELEAANAAATSWGAAVGARWERIKAIQSSLLAMGEASAVSGDRTEADANSVAR